MRAIIGLARQSKNGYRHLWLFLLTLCLVLGFCPLSSIATDSQCGITLITHGYLFPGKSRPDWAKDMANAIKARTGSSATIHELYLEENNWASDSDDEIVPVDIDLSESGGAIFVLDWSSIADDLATHSAQNAADVFFEYLFSQSHNGHSLAQLPIHLIGHSRGASLNSRIAYILAANGIVVEQVTTLDPHPVNSDWVPETFINVIFADNYFQDEDPPVGMQIMGAHNQPLSSVLDAITPFKQHSQVHTYYHGTINLSRPLVVDELTVENSWYLGTKNASATGYNFSRYVDPNVRRPHEGVHHALEDAGGSGLRALVPLAHLGWANVVLDSRSSYPRSAQVGSACSFPYSYVDRDSEQTITFFLDSDSNPFNGTTRDIGTLTKGSRPAGSLGTDNFIWTPTAPATEPLFVGVRTTGVGQSTNSARYDYFSEQITVSPTSAIGTPSFLSANAVSHDQINISWANVSGEDGYTLERKVNGGSWSQRATLGANLTTYSDKGLTAETTYSYRVRAHGASGYSGYSPTKSATTFAISSETFTIRASALSVSPLALMQVNMYSWEGVSTAFSSDSTVFTRSADKDATVTVSAPYTSSGGKHFQYWIMDNGLKNYSINARQVMDEDKIIIAMYDSAPPVIPTLSSLRVEGPSRVDERSTAPYFAKATFSDGSTAYVDADWDEDSSYTSISADGLLNASSVSSDKDVEVEATYSSGGNTESDTKDITVENVDTVQTYTLTLNASNGHINPSPDGPTYAAGTEVRLTAYADNFYVRGNWGGDASGTDRSVYVTMNGNRSVTHSFVLDSSEGDLTCHLFPPQAAAEGAGWKVWGPDHWYTNYKESDTTYGGINSGSHHVRFSDIPGWTTPENFTATVVGGEVNHVSGTYTEMLGGIRITIQPFDVVSAGARWRIDGGSWVESGTLITDVSTGNHTVDFQAVSGWTAPMTQNVNVERATTSSKLGEYTPPIGQPIITDIFPENGPPHGGTEVTVVGANFTEATSVQFGGLMSTSVTYISNSELLALSPASQSFGTVNLLISTGTKTTEVANGFSYLNALGANMEMVGQIGGNVQAVAVENQTAYYGQGSQLVCVNITDPSSPQILGNVTLPANIHSIAVKDDVAYVSASSPGLFAVNVSDPNAPSIRGFYDTEGYTFSASIFSNLAYVADGNSGLSILDISDPSAIRFVGSTNTKGRAEHVSVGMIGSGTYAFLAEGNLGLRIIDVSIPTAPIEIGFVPAEGAAGLDDVLLVNQTLFVSDWAGGIKIYNSSNPSNIVEIGNRGNVGAGVKIDVVNGLVYSCSTTLQVHDSSVLPTPTRLGQFDMPPSTYDLVVTNGVALAAMGPDGLHIVDISSPDSMNLESSLSTLSKIEEVYVLNEILYVGNNTGLHIYDLSSPVRPAFLASLPGRRATEVVVKNGIAVMVNFGDEEVVIADVSSPSSPVVLDTYTATEAWNVALLGDIPIISGATPDEDYKPKIDVLDISSPSSTTSKGSLEIATESGSASSIATHGSWVFAGRHNKSLDILDLSNPSSPSKVGGVPISNFFRDVVVSQDGQVVYVADAADGVQLVDVSVKSSPSLLQIIETPQSPEEGSQSVHVFSNRLYSVAGGYIFAYDISSPTNPVVLGYYDIPSSGYEIATIGDIIYTAGSSAGIQILRLNDIDNPLITITSPASDAAFSTTNNQISISGISSDNELVSRVTWRNSRGGGGISTGTTSWAALGIKLASGMNRITFTVEDDSRNTATDTIDVNYTISDTTPPIVLITGPSQFDTVQVDTIPIELWGTVSDETLIQSVAWTNHNGSYGPATTIGSAWGVSNVSLSIGLNLFEVTAMDSSSNSATDTVAIFFRPRDTNAPLVTIEFPTIDEELDSSHGTINLSGMSSDDVSLNRVEWYSDIGTQGVAIGTAPWSVNDIPLKQGLNTIDIEAVDDAGNTASDTLSVIYRPRKQEVNLAGIANTNFNIVVSGAYGDVIVLETSTNLYDWIPLSTNIIPPEGTLMIEGIVPTDSQRQFFRTYIDQP